MIHDGPLTDPRDAGGRPPGAPDAGRRAVPVGVTEQANRRWWDAEADAYHREHGPDLGDRDLLWCPEGLREDDADLVACPPGGTVLEFGAGAAQGSRHLADRGVQVVACDLSAGMLRVARRIDAGCAAYQAVPLVQCNAMALPFADSSFDVVFTAYGAVPFVRDLDGLVRQCARVLKPGGRLVYATSHPIRWAFPDSPDEAGLTARHSYFDRTPYVESTGGRVDYVEHHRTIGDHVRAVVAAGLDLVDLLEPEWTPGRDVVWGGWSPLRGRLLPGTAVFVARRRP